MAKLNSKEPVWIFGYGSLMWRPGFSYEKRSMARINGYHRHFCVWSHRYRGSPRVPGLVLGLDRGGSCRGIAYRITSDRADEVLDYLDGREMITGVYRPMRLTMRLMGQEPGLHPRDARITAQTYVVDRGHSQYAGTLSDEERATLVIQGVGTAGSCREYLDNTVQYLNKMAVPDRRLAGLLGLVEQMTRGERPISPPPLGPPPHPANQHLT